MLIVIILALIALTWYTIWYYTRRPDAVEERLRRQIYAEGKAERKRMQLQRIEELKRELKEIQQR